MDRADALELLTDLTEGRRRYLPKGLARDALSTLIGALDGRQDDRSQLQGVRAEEKQIRIARGMNRPQGT